eukprot:gene675-3511_t
MCAAKPHSPQVPPAPQRTLGKAHSPAGPHAPQQPPAPKVASKSRWNGCKQTICSTRLQRAQKQASREKAQAKIQEAKQLQLKAKQLQEEEASAGANSNDEDAAHDAAMRAVLGDISLPPGQLCGTRGKAARCSMSDAQPGETPGSTQKAADMQASGEVGTLSPPQAAGEPASGMPKGPTGFAPGPACARLRAGRRAGLGGGRSHWSVMASATAAKTDMGNFCATRELGVAAADVAVAAWRREVGVEAALEEAAGAIQGMVDDPTDRVSI